jgi:dihydroxyacetone kinase-like predicted kinase
MKIKLGIRGNTDAINHIIIKIDDLMLITADNLFLTGEEDRDKTGKNLVQLLDSLSKDHEISIGENVAKEIERELNLKNNEIKKYSK